MITNLKKLINTDVKKRLFSNSLSLSVLQAGNLILPLLTFPYLIRAILDILPLIKNNAVEIRDWEVALEHCSKQINFE